MNRPDDTFFFMYSLKDEAVSPGSHKVGYRVVEAPIAFTLVSYRQVVPGSLSDDVEPGRIHLDDLVRYPFARSLVGEGEDGVGAEAGEGTLPVDLYRAVHLPPYPQLAVILLKKLF